MFGDRLEIKKIAMTLTMKKGEKMRVLCTCFHMDLVIRIVDIQVWVTRQFCESRLRCASNDINGSILYNQRIH